MENVAYDVFDKFPELPPNIHWGEVRKIIFILKILLYILFNFISYNFTVLNYILSLFYYCNYYILTRKYLYLTSIYINIQLIQFKIYNIYI